MDPKRCSRCQDYKPREEFGRLGTKGKQAYCRDCRSAYYQENKQRWRKSDLYRRYKISLDYFEELLFAQGGACAVCGTGEPGGRGSFSVDHDHACCPGGKSCGECVRGLLCHHCNLMLGSARDSVTTLYSAIEYLHTYARHR